MVWGVMWRPSASNASGERDRRGARVLRRQRPQLLVDRVDHVARCAARPQDQHRQESGDGSACEVRRLAVRISWRHAARLRLALAHRADSAATIHRLPHPLIRLGVGDERLLHAAALRCGPARLHVPRRRVEPRAARVAPLVGRSATSGWFI